MANAYAGSTATDTSKVARQLFLVCVLLTLAIFFVPYGRIIGYPVLLISTLVHEMGHGITALLVGAQFDSFQMWSDGSGVAAISGPSSAISNALIAAGGLVGPSIAAAITFFAARHTSVARIFLSLLGVGLIACEFLFVRNAFAWVFVGCLAAIFLWLAQESRPVLAKGALVFIAIELSMSVFSRSDYLFTDRAITAQGVIPSDVAAIAEALLLPYWFWGAICALFSVAVLGLGLWSYVSYRSTPD